MPLVDSDLEKLVELLNKIDIRVQVRRKTAAEWTSTNEVLLDSEWGYEHDTGKIKIGDGATAWNALAYWGGGGGDTIQVETFTSTATVTPAVDDDLVIVSAQTGPLTIANPAGTESDGQGFVLRIRDNGTAAALTWGIAYRPVGGTLPTTTVTGQWLYLPAAYNAADDKWDVFFDQVGASTPADPGVQIQTFTSTATVTPSYDDDMIVISAQAAGLTIADPSGAAAWGDGFVLAIKDNGTARALTWGAGYRGMGATLSAITTAGKWMYFPISRNQTDSKWDVFPPTVQL